MKKLGWFLALCLLGWAHPPLIFATTQEPPVLPLLLRAEGATTTLGAFIDWVNRQVGTPWIELDQPDLGKRSLVMPALQAHPWFYVLEACRQTGVAPFHHAHPVRLSSYAPAILDLHVHQDGIIVLRDTALVSTVGGEVLEALNVEWYPTTGSTLSAQLDRASCAPSTVIHPVRVSSTPHAWTWSLPAENFPPEKATHLDLVLALDRLEERVKLVTPLEEGFSVTQSKIRLNIESIRRTRHDWVIFFQIEWQSGLSSENDQRFRHLLQQMLEARLVEEDMQWLESMRRQGLRSVKLHAIRGFYHETPTPEKADFEMRITSQPLTQRGRLVMPAEKNAKPLKLLQFEVEVLRQTTFPVSLKVASRTGLRAISPSNP